MKRLILKLRSNTFVLRVVSFILACSVMLSTFTLSAFADYDDARTDLFGTGIYGLYEDRDTKYLSKDEILTSGNILGYSIVQNNTFLNPYSIAMTLNSFTPPADGPFIDPNITSDILYASFVLIGVGDNGHLYTASYDKGLFYDFDFWYYPIDEKFSLHYHTLDGPFLSTSSTVLLNDESALNKYYLALYDDFAVTNMFKRDIFNNVSYYFDDEHISPKYYNLDRSAATYDGNITPFWVYVPNSDSGINAIIKKASDLGLFINDLPDTSGNLIDDSNSTLKFDYSHYNNNHEGENGITVDFILPSNEDNAVGYSYIDWLKLGKQYPIIDFGVNDNENKHNYSVRISVNRHFADKIKEFVQSEEAKDWISNGLNFIGVALAAKGHIKVGSLFINARNSTGDTLELLDTLSQIQMINSLDTSIFDVCYTLSSPELDFSNTESVARIFSLCLSDYVTIEENLMYRIDVIDNTSGYLIDSTYFSSSRTYNKGNSGYGVVVSDYSNLSNYTNDITNNTPNSSADNTFTADKFQQDNYEDLYQSNFDLNSVGIGDIFGNLQQSVNGIGSFFQACWSLLPPAMWSIILASLALLIILRILGR